MAGSMTLIKDQYQAEQVRQTLLGPSCHTSSRDLFVHTVCFHGALSAMTADLLRSFRRARSTLCPPHTRSIAPLYYRSSDLTLLESCNPCSSHGLSSCYFSSYRPTSEFLNPWCASFERRQLIDQSVDSLLVECGFLVRTASKSCYSDLPNVLHVGY